MLDMLGYFEPADRRTQLDTLNTFTCFSSCCFSVKVQALRAIGYFSPFLSKKGKTQLWATVYERLGGHVNGCKSKKAPSPDACCPAKGGEWN